MRLMRASYGQGSTRVKDVVRGTERSRAFVSRMFRALLGARAVVADARTGQRGLAFAHVRLAVATAHRVALRNAIDQPRVDAFACFVARSAVRRRRIDAAQGLLA